MCTCAPDDEPGQRRAPEEETAERPHLVDEQHARDQLGDALVDVRVDDLVDLGPQLVRHLCPAALDELPHDAHDVLPALRPRVRHVEVVQRHVLDNLLLLVHVALGQRDVLFRLKVVLGRVRV
jgi:hypothetical protein